MINNVKPIAANEKNVAYTSKWTPSYATNISTELSHWYVNTTPVNTKPETDENNVNAGFFKNAINNVVNADKNKTTKANISVCYYLTLTISTNFCKLGVTISINACGYTPKNKTMIEIMKNVVHSAQDKSGKLKFFEGPNILA